MKCADTEAAGLLLPTAQVLAFKMQTGQIKLLNERGFGFIGRKSFDKDLFFHANELRSTRFDELSEGDIVEFETIEGPKGSFAASLGVISGANRENQEETFDDEINPNDETDYANEEIEEPIENSVVLAFKDFHKLLVRMLAAKPNEIHEIEWRNLEWIIAEAFLGLGFEVELTPSSKDGGKDIILSFEHLGRKKFYIVEIKHWRSGKRVGDQTVGCFVHVVARESRQGGLFLASNGFTKRAIEYISEIDHFRIGLGANSKIVSLCRNYVKAQDGVWRPPHDLEEVIFEETIYEPSHSCPTIKIT